MHLLSTTGCLILLTLGMVQSLILEGNKMLFFIITLSYLLLIESRILIWKIIPQKIKRLNVSRTVSKNTMKKIGHHARKRDNMGKSIYA